MSELVIPIHNQLFEDMIYNPYDDGWHFGAGDPEFWKYSDMLLKPKGKLLDLGVGDGRTSLFFGLHGMEITGFDTNKEAIRRFRDTVSSLRESIPMHADLIVDDVTTAELPKDTFDTVIVGSMVHLPTRAAALRLIGRAYESVKPGGHVWVRAVGKEASAYQEVLLDQESYRDITLEDDKHVMWHPCECSGEYRIDPTVFLDPFDIHTLLTSEGARLRHSQTIPGEWVMNVMFGEDYKGVKCQMQLAA